MKCVNEAQFQRLVQERPDLAKFFHYVKAGKDGRRGFYRRIPPTYYDKEARPKSQLRAQLALSESSHASFGKRGLKDGIPVVAAINRENLRGRKFTLPPWKQALEKLRESLKEVVEVVTRET